MIVEQYSHAFHYKIRLYFILRNILHKPYEYFQRNNIFISLMVELISNITHIKRSK